MDSEGAQNLQRGEELASTEEDAAAIAVREYVKDLHTALPGIVKSFDAETQTVSVQLTIKRLWIDEEIGWQPLPPLVNCPVQFPRWGNFIVTGPVSEGDEGLVHFAERAIDNWHHAGSVQEAAEYRLHDLSDGFFSPGYSSKGRVPSNIAGDALEIRTLDGQTLIRLEGGAAIIGTTIGAEKAIKGETYRAAEDALLLAICTNLDAALGANGLPTTTLDAAKQAFDQAAATGAFLATKAKVG